MGGLMLCCCHFFQIFYRTLVLPDRPPPLSNVYQSPEVESNVKLLLDMSPIGTVILQSQTVYLTRIFDPTCLLSRPRLETERHNISDQQQTC